MLRKSAELLKKQSNDTRQLLQQYRHNSGGKGTATPQDAVREGWQRQQPPVGASTGAHASPQAGEGAVQRRQAQGMHAIEEQIHEVDDEEALLMASLARLDCKLAEAADPAAAYLQAAEYKETQQKRHDMQAQKAREARRAPVAIRKLPRHRRSTTGIARKICSSTACSRRGTRPPSTPPGAGRTRGIRHPHTGERAKGAPVRYRK